MGYHTDFSGDGFQTDKPVDEETYQLLHLISSTRRMARDNSKLAEQLGLTLKQVEKKYGVEGEFYGTDSYSEDKTIINVNQSPAPQPGLWCQWMMDEDKQTIDWDGGEKFYEYEEWLTYLIERILKPRGYKLSGSVYWSGEEDEDTGEIIIKDNVMTVKSALVFYLTDEEKKKVTKLVNSYLESNFKEVIDHKLEQG